MVSKEHHPFDTDAARKLADDLELSIDEWASRAGVSAFTIRKFLYGDPSIKMTTVDDIARPLGRTALDLIKKNGTKKRA